MTNNILEIKNSTGSAVVFDGVSYANGAFVPLHKFTTYKVGYKKLWSSDSGRSMTGEQKGTLIGIFPKLEITIGNMTDDNQSAIVNLTMVAATDVKYYDSGSKSLKTASFYFGDVDTEMLSKNMAKYKPCSFSIISRAKR